MNRDRWQQVDQILEEVLEISETEREKFLSARCGSDKELFDEVSSLLQAHDEAENLYETSAINLIAKNIARKEKPQAEISFEGKTLNQYQLIKIIGKGGMGTVYLGYDKKLKRDVAVKILKSPNFDKTDRINRFKREARAISALNHPNIVTIYDVGSVDGINYIATEFVEGEILSEYVVKGVNLRGGLHIIIQCCDALASAHKAGIIHRDIKPDNIIVRPDGYIKILDFGLAKLTAPKKPDDMLYKTTANGFVMGTPSYMSPEQISDEPVGPHSDIWSLGLVLYELLTGINPFKKTSKVETFEAIQNLVPPDASKLNSEIPPELDRVLAKSLKKLPEDRYQSINDFRSDLVEILQEFEESSLSRKTGKFPNRNKFGFAKAAFYFTTLFLLFAVGGLIFWNFSSLFTSSKSIWIEAQKVRLTNYAGTEFFPSFEPNGENFAFAYNKDDNFDIYLRRVQGQNAINLTGNFPGNDTQPSFSPDGKFIAFRSERDGGGIFIMEKTGENPRRISDFGFHPAWSPDGKEIAVSEKGFVRPIVADKSNIWIIDVANGEKRKLIGEAVYQPSWSPNGKRIAFWGIGTEISNRYIATIPTDGGNPQKIEIDAGENWNPVWSPDGEYLYFSSNLKGNMAIWRIRINQDTGETFDKPELVPTPGKFNGHIAFSSDGRRLIYAQIDEQVNLKAVDFNSSTEKPLEDAKWITTGDQEIHRPRLSPDGEVFVINLTKQTQEDILLIDRHGNNLRSLTNDKYFDRFPLWTADGKQIIFNSDRSNLHQIWLVNADGSNLTQLTNNNEQVSFATASPVKKQITYRYRNEDTHYILDFTDLQNLRERRLPNSAGTKFASWDWSQDGDRIIGRWYEADGAEGIGFYSISKQKFVKVWQGSGSMPSWLPDSKRIIFANQGKIHILDSVSEQLREIQDLPEKNVTGVGISRDGKLLYFTVKVSESNIWLLDSNENN